MRALGTKQIIALAYVAQRGEHAPSWGNRPWQLDGVGDYLRVLDSLIKRGLVEKSADRGVVRWEMRVGATSTFVPFYTVTAAGREVLVSLKEGSSK